MNNDSKKENLECVIDLNNGADKCPTVTNVTLRSLDEITILDCSYAINVFLL